ncbi:hypothetical protein HH1059_00860 [Halorhodospira halochloris]|uniref:Lipoprotein n=1 Tax=Halorhodospira halochloris TaxID=1052 RepID=A0A120MZL2_HALHR|nr:DUF6175 family protein [Halorhodospira halochloris]MBK1650749.1 hypothetical protein [Halorhodospira halochloris]BAU56756.1 hypothetical protein HH1059_00860 [Halorhodospira halochloris]
MKSQNLFRIAASSAAMLGTVALIGCETAPEEPDTYVPTSRQGEEIEAVSAAEVTIRARGIGPDTSAARDDARRAAIYYALYSGTHPLLPDSDARSAFEEHEEEIFANATNYISDYSSPLSRHQDGDDQVVEKEVRVNTARLQEELVDRDVIDDPMEILAELGRPRIAVIPESEEDEDDARPAITMISEYLQERDFDVEVPRAGDEVDEIVSQAAALEGDVDPMYELALQAGSDVYITVSVDEESRDVGGSEVLSASVSATAYYTATGDQLGATTGHSPERDVSGHRAVIEEAANAVGNRVTRQIANSWADEVERGRPFKVVFSAAEADAGDISREMHRIFSDVCPESNRNAAGQTSFDYTLRCTEQNDAMDLLIDLETAYGGPGTIERNLDSGALLILSVGDIDDADDIVIQ